MTFTTNLFHAINAADEISIDGYDTENEIEFIGDELRIRHLEDDKRVHFKDQDIEIENGMAKAKGVFALETEEIEFEFYFVKVKREDLEQADVDDYKQRCG